MAFTTQQESTAVSLNCCKCIAFGIVYWIKSIMYNRQTLERKEHKLNNKVSEFAIFAFRRISKSIIFVVYWTLEGAKSTVLNVHVLECNIYSHLYANTLPIQSPDISKKLSYDVWKK